MVLLVLARGDATLHVGFYDLAVENFLPAIAVLSVQERCTLGSRRTREAFLRELIASARTAQSRAAVGA